ncbi:hypothetical protein M0638_01375 [Roseomonas sp. NAR14]|uniref:Uncharacterized protein n=1 Tax=Roseomonas acroporae TaxID=2937791 RepID=A0A9X1YAR5_9PROT|nr:hypothetical protein [Roseomonas acroporae]MCK8783031.1 hypothetical protein [Roseomonas acroporae]
MAPPPPMAPPLALFPPAPGITFTRNGRLDAAVKAAAAALPAGGNGKPVSLCLIDLGVLADDPSPPADLPFGGAEDGTVHYTASLVKVGVQYSLYALRDLARRFATLRSPANGPAFFAAARAELDPFIARASPVIAGAPLRREHRIPSWDKVFTAGRFGSGLAVEFQPGMRNSLENMIVSSENPETGRCVRGQGYAYLNGALEAAGLFDSPTKTGFYVGGDFSGGSTWPYARIPSANDGDVAQASTAFTVAKLMALIAVGGLLDKPSCAEMRGRLGRAARGEAKPGHDADQSWLTRDPSPVGFDNSRLALDKIGLGPLKTGREVISEGLVLRGPGGRSYAVAYQNGLNNAATTRALVAGIRAAILANEALSGASGNAGVPGTGRGTLP